MTPKKAYRQLRHYDYLSCWCGIGEECHVDEYIKAIERGYAKRRSNCLYCPHRLRHHYSIEMLNEFDEVDALGAVCPRCNPSDRFDPLNDGVCLVLPFQ